jgi:hypothetical protein
VEILVNTFFEERVQQLLNLADRVEKLFSAAGLEYRVVGGLAAYLYVEEAERDAGRLTKDIDITVGRGDLKKIAGIAPQFGLQYRHTAGSDMLVQVGEPSARRAVHLIFSGEKVRPEYSEAAPEIGPCRTIRQIRVIPLADSVRMKLTSFRLKDQVHIKDLDEVGLITPDVEAQLSPILRDRLAQTRATE